MVGTKSKPPVPDNAQAIDLDAWIASLSAGRTAQQLEKIRRACEFAQAAHGDQKRLSGEPHLHHSLTVAEILDDLHMDSDTIVAAILHDVVEDTAIELAGIEKEFGSTISILVDGVTKMAVIAAYPATEPTADRRAGENAESLRKMLLAMAEDVRVVLIKLADRLHNMRTLGWLPEARQRRIARETLDIYAPLANRLGIWQMKWELEDLSFRYLEPETYRRLATLLDETREDREEFIAETIQRLQSELARAGVKAEITGRPKHIYSIWRKMQRKHIDFNQVFDVRAVRILVDDLAGCYTALGIVHGLWRHVPGEFDDYIATPKDNLYQSLHTAVVGPDGRTLEVQIRTHEMHQHAELGVAAHWRYKEGSRYDAGFEQRIAWLRQFLEWREEASDAGDFIERFKAEVYQDRVYVLTPRGKVMDLQQGSTPLDFAYHVHTDVGHRCRGAKVNGHMVPLTYELKSGDCVEVLTSRQGRPSRDWLSPHLGYIRSARARAKIRTWFKQQDYDKNVADGRSTLDRELRRLGVEHIDQAKLLKRFHYRKYDDLLAALGRGEVSSVQIAGLVEDPLRQRGKEELPEIRQRPAETPGTVGGIRIEGVGNLLTQMARCCKPVPQEPIVGYITRGRGVTIHRRDCPSLLRMQQTSPERLIQVAWGGHGDATYPVDVQVTAYDRQGLLHDISGLLSNEKINVLAVNTFTETRDHMARMTLTLEISDLAQLSRALDKIGRLPNVVEVTRHA